jgi:hypothetical protein
MYYRPPRNVEEGDSMSAAKGDPREPDTPGGGEEDPGRDGPGSPSRAQPDSPGGGTHDPDRSARGGFASSEPDSPGGGEGDAAELDRAERQPESPGGGEDDAP